MQPKPNASAPSPYWLPLTVCAKGSFEHFWSLTKNDNGCVWLATYNKSVTAQTKLNSISVMQSLLSQMTFTHNKNKTTSDHWSSMPMIASDWQGIASY